jgi:5S rRNA maturation endonuclease (ribonuclease M5)
LSSKSYPTAAPNNRVIWKIKDPAGRVVAEHVREDRPDGKDVFWRLPGGSLSDGLKGRKLETLPLYGAHELDEWPEDRPVAVVEGEKSADALNGSGIIFALGTVTGAGATPGPEALEVLRGREVILWTDADERGRKHMRRVAERLEGVAELVRWYDWPEAKEKDDAADHPAVIGGSEKALGILLDDLLGAPEWRPAEPEKPEGLPGRVDLGQLLLGGIEPTPQLLEGLLYEGRIHSIASGPGTGKTLLALWMAVQVMRQGRPVLYLDAENGPKLIAERFAEIGASPAELSRLLHYFPAEVALDAKSLGRLAATVEEIEPALVVFDSFADLLSIAGLEENSNDDCTRWMRTVAQPIKDAGSAVLVLDHVPKGGKGPRGGGSKRAKVDVQWNLEATQHFDRERTGEIELKHDKDREAWLPKIVRFSVGGGVFSRSAGTIEDEGPSTELTALQREVYEYIRKRGAEGAAWGDILDGTGCSKGSLSPTLKKLDRLDLIEKDNGRYYAKRTEPEKSLYTPDS